MSCLKPDGFVDVGEVFIDFDKLCIDGRLLSLSFLRHLNNISDLSAPELDSKTELSEMKSVIRLYE